MTDTTLSAGGLAAPPQARTRIKLCGLSHPADVDHAVALGADVVGFVFYPKSPRAVTIEQAAELARRVPPFVSAVGLFVNATPEELARVLDAVPLTTLQFHGDETPEQCLALAREARLPWMRALRVGARRSAPIWYNRHLTIRQPAACCSTLMCRTTAAAAKSSIGHLFPQRSCIGPF